MNFTSIVSRYTGFAKMNFPRQGFWKLFYYTHTCATEVI